MSAIIQVGKFASQKTYKLENSQVGKITSWKTYKLENFQVRKLFQLKNYIDLEVDGVLDFDSSQLKQ